MPAKDRYHDAVKHALIKDGWVIDEEQYPLTVDKRNLWIDLLATKDIPQLVILVEVKELAEVDSAIEALANAVGKVVLYRLALQFKNIQLPLFLAVSKGSYDGILSERIGQLVLAHEDITLIVVDADKEEIAQWIP